MNKRLFGAFWGILLTAAGAYALAETLGYEAPDDPLVWALVFGGISVIALILYLIDGLRNWVWLIPVGVFGGLATITGLAAAGVTSAAMAVPLFIGIGLPFVVAYAIDRSGNWWALIPAGVMAFLTFAVLAADSARAEWVGAGLFLILAIAFFLVYLGRQKLWAAIVAYVMLALAGVIWMGATANAMFAGVLVFLAIGLPFLFAYLTSPDRWWAIIPAGIMFSMGVVTALVLIPGLPSPASEPGVANAIFLAGVAGTFAIVWLRHHMRWAMVVTIVAAVSALGMLFFAGMYTFWPLVAMALGVYIVFRALRPRHA